MRFLGVLLGLGLGVAQAGAPDSSLRPLVRGGGEATAVPSKVRIIRVTASKLAPPRSLRPQARGGKIARAPEPVVPKVADLGASRGVKIEPVLPKMVSLRPSPRPKFVVRKPAGGTQKVGLFKRKDKEPRVTAKGSVCGVKEIKGQSIPPIPGRIRGCGVSKPVAVTSVSGVALTSAAKIDCTTAKALNTWVKNSVKPTIGKLGGGVSSLKVAAHYACRTRNNKRGGKISEHGKGRAIDISAINLKNGKSITVLKGWRRNAEGKILKRIHKDACGPFGTVLGPNADRYHQDHFHFDTARYRSGSYCR